MTWNEKLQQFVCKTTFFVLAIIGITLLISLEIFAPTGINRSSKMMAEFYNSMPTMRINKTNIGVLPSVQEMTETERKLSYMRINKTNIEVLPSLREITEAERNLEHENHFETFARRLPGCIIIGSKKCGTGALISHLDMHPEIVAHQGEPHFFDNHTGNFDLGLEWYRKQMPKSTLEQITIEKSPRYFVTWETPRRILEFNKTIKLILIVRDPVTRAISDYVHTKSIAFGEEGFQINYPSFESIAINDTTGKVNEDWVIINTSKYSEHFEHWLKFFPREHIHIVDGEKYITDPASELKKVETYLGIQHWFKNDIFEYDPQKGFMCVKYGSFTSCLGKIKGRKHPDVKPEVTKMLKEYFTPYNKKFYEFAGYDYGWERF